MVKLLSSKLGWLRIVSVLEGISLIVLVLVGVPLKRIWGMPETVQILGPIHGVLFLLFCLNLFGAAIEYRWKWITSSQIFLASIIPFGTLFIDHRILKPMWELQNSK